MKYMDRGQIMPFCLFIILILVWLIYSNFELGFLQVRKIEQQKKLDAYSLNMATQMARGYNGIAAINEGLKALTIHTEVVTTVVGVFTACSFVAPPCAQYMKRLAPKLPQFYERVYKLGDIMKRDQENIAKWMIRTHCAMREEARLQFSNFAVYPKYRCSMTPDISQLPFYRSTGDSVDPTHCKSIHVDGYPTYESSISNYRSNPDLMSASVIATYKNYETGKTHSESPDNIREAALLPAMKILREDDRYVTYSFISAEISHCVKSSDIIAKYASRIGALARLPQPLQFKPEFFQIQNRMIALAAGKVDSPFRDQHGDILTSINEKLWTTTETKIIGDDFSSMEFKPRLNPVSLTNELDQTLQGWDSILAGYPKLTGLENDIHH